MKILGQVSGLNIFVDENVNAIVTISVKKPEPWDKILVEILEAHQLDAEFMEENTIRVFNIQNGSPNGVSSSDQAISTFGFATVSYMKAEFSISLPIGWIEIPRKIIDEYEKVISGQAPDAPAQHFDYGFQLDSSKNWFQYPYILIQVRNTGRIPGTESQWEKLEGEYIQKGVDKLKKGFSPIMSDVEAGKIIYDKQNKMIWLRIEANILNLGPITGLSGMIPTEKGMIIVNGYSLKDDFSIYESLFQAVAMSVSPDPSIAYKPRWSDNLSPFIAGLDWGKIIIKGLAGGMALALIFGILAVIELFRKKSEGIKHKENVMAKHKENPAEKRNLEISPKKDNCH